ncbi:MAG: hypothetical protein KDH96_10540, partial [Candidatus Riesia sp.]|nr:hypothetical protein [Candidatus Riesia sp.]
YYRIMKNYKEWLLYEKYTHKELDNRFWKNGKFDESIRDKLIKISDEFVETLPINLDIEDIKLTGSIANYNYTKDSDLDLHIIVDYDKIEEKEEVLSDLFSSKGFIWNLKHDINMRGADVEIYIQDINEPHQSTGTYSILNNKWIKKPTYTDPDVDDNLVNKKYNKWVYTISKLIDKVEDDVDEEEWERYYKLAEKLKDKLKEFRTKGLHEGEGEFSVENIVYKKLRNNGFIDKLYDSYYDFYDNMYSQ